MICSIVHNHEFSARFSVGSILRLRAAAIMALKQDAKTDTALILRLARRFLHVSNYQAGRTEAVNPSELHSAVITVEEPDHHVYVGQYLSNSFSEGCSAPSVVNVEICVAKRCSCYRK